MKKSVNLYFDNNKLEKDKLIKIKQIGFDEFFTGIREGGEDLREQCEYASSLGLSCTMIHCLYNESNLHYFWEKGKAGDEICDNYCAQIKKIVGLTQNFVIHLNANKDQKQSLIGIRRIKKILRICQKYDINLCIENLYSETEIPYIFKKIKHDKLKICFDVGHKNFLTPNFELLEKYYKYIEVLHLHDNNGAKDEHLICGRGNVDWKRFAKQLALVPNIVLSAEVKETNSDIDFLREVYDGLVLIESYMHK